MARFDATVKAQVEAVLTEEFRTLDEIGEALDFQVPLLASVMQELAQEGRVEVTWFERPQRFRRAVPLLCRSLSTSQPGSVSLPPCPRARWRARSSSQGCR